MTAAESESDFRITANSHGSPGVSFCEDFEENWPRYNGTALYLNCVEHIPSLDRTGILGFTWKCPNARPATLIIQSFSQLQRVYTACANG